MTLPTTTPPTLEGLKITGVTPFWSPADARDEELAQAHALLLALSAGYETCAESGQGGPAFDTLTYPLKARALDGIATLIALAQHHSDAAHFALPSRTEQPVGKCGEWGARLSAYQTAKARLDEHCATSTPADPDGCKAYENKTDELAEAHAEAFDALLLTPAPNSAALAYKLELWVHVVGSDCWTNGADLMKQIAADSRRFAEAR